MDTDEQTHTVQEPPSVTRQSTRRILTSTVDNPNTTETDRTKAHDLEPFDPTGSTGKRLKKQVLNVLPLTGKGAPDIGVAVSGGDYEVKSEETIIPVNRAEWKYEDKDWK